MLKDDKSLKDVIRDEEKLEKKIKELQSKPKTNEKLNLLGRLEFLQRNQKKLKNIKILLIIFKTLNKLVIANKIIVQKVEQRVD